VNLGRATDPGRTIFVAGQEDFQTLDFTEFCATWRRSSRCGSCCPRDR
jgi:hypothetical protein